jgi:Raf kinase inhibitor-like YbhB/YbcL family protein
MRSLRLLAPALLALAPLVTACGDDGSSVYRSGGIQVSSPAFAPGGSIPKEHAPAPDGKNVSPPLSWSGAPAATKAYALFVDDPDAGPPPFVHWVVWNVPATTTSLPAGVAPTAPEFVQGKNGYGAAGWGGPEPPPGATHKYAFTVYALDAPLGLPAGSAAGDVLEAMKGHVLAQGRLVAKYP